MEQKDNDKLEILFKDHAYFLTTSIIAPIDLALNLFGIFVIVMTPSTEMGTYKWYLLNLQVWSTIFDSSKNVLQLNYWFPLSVGTADHGWNRFIGLPGHAVFVIQPTLCFLSATAMVSCGMHRYNAARDISGTATKRGFSERKLFLICLALHIFIATTFLTILGLSYTDNETLQEYFKQNYPHLVSQVSTVRLVGNFLEVNIWICIYYVWALICLQILTSIWVFCTFSTLQILRKLKTSLAPEALQLHRWLLVTHIVQTVVPFLLFSPPMAATVVLFFGRFNRTGRFGTTMLCVHGVHGAANTLIVLTMIRSYRNYILDRAARIFRCMNYRRKAVSEVTRVTSFHASKST